MKSSEIDFDNLPIYIIHCTNSQERRNIILSQIEKLGSKNIKIFDAITPETLHLYDEYK